MEEVWRRVVEANLRYYEALGRLSLDYVRSVAGAVGDLRGPRAGVSATSPPRRPEPASGAGEAPASTAMVLEADAGASALGAFLVENLLEDRISAPVVASTFVGPTGHEVQPRLVFDPEVVTLEPGEQVLVRAVAAIDEDLEAGAAYRGEVSVPGLGSRGVSIVVRRRPADGPRPRTRRASRPSSASTRRRGGDGARRAG